MEKINIADKFSKITNYWHPYILAELNGQAVKAAKLKGEFIWHKHELEDELFLIFKGSLLIEFREKSVRLNEGDFFVVPKGIEHRPIADEECWVLLFEPSETFHTGDVLDERTVHKSEYL